MTHDMVGCWPRLCLCGDSRRLGLGSRPMAWLMLGLLAAEQGRPRRPGVTESCAVSERASGIADGCPSQGHRLLVDCMSASSWLCILY